jgi:hypothetical protein
LSLDHTQTHNTVGRTPLDEGSARRRDIDDLMKSKCNDISSGDRLFQDEVFSNSSKIISSAHFELIFSHNLPLSPVHSTQHVKREHGPHGIEDCSRRLDTHCHNSQPCR